MAQGPTVCFIKVILVILKNKYNTVPQEVNVLMLFQYQRFRTTICCNFLFYYHRFRTSRCFYHTFKTSRWFKCFYITTGAAQRWYQRGPEGPPISAAGKAAAEICHRALVELRGSLRTTQSSSSSAATSCAAAATTPAPSASATTTTTTAA